MAFGSGIEWTESTWNPVTGCDKISPGCKHCYAERLAERLQAMGQPNYRNGFALTLQPQMLELPLRWKKPQTIFVNSMSDLFHEDVSLAYIQRVFDVMRRAHWHRFQVLTKRAHRLAELSTQIEWSKNVWMGVSVETADYVDRIDDLRATGAHVKFLSLEPLLGPLPKLKLNNIDWVIVGGESGHGARPMDPAWVADIRDQCARAGVAFFFKQWGAARTRRKRVASWMVERGTRCLRSLECAAVRGTAVAQSDIVDTSLQSDDSIGRAANVLAVVSGSGAASAGAWGAHSAGEDAAADFRNVVRRADRDFARHVEPARER